MLRVNFQLQCCVVVRSVVKQNTIVWFLYVVLQSQNSLKMTKSTSATFWKYLFLLHNKSSVAVSPPFLFHENSHLFLATSEAEHADHLSVVPDWRQWLWRMLQLLHLLQKVRVISVTVQQLKTHTWPFATFIKCFSNLWENYLKRFHCV